MNSHLSDFPHQWFFFTLHDYLNYFKKEKKNKENSIMCVNLVRT